MINELQRSVEHLASPHEGLFAHHRFLRETDAVMHSLAAMEDVDNAGPFDPSALGRIVQNVDTAIELIEVHLSTCRDVGRVAKKLAASIYAIRAVEENLFMRLRSDQSTCPADRPGVIPRWTFENLGGALETWAVSPALGVHQGMIVRGF